MTSTAEDKNRRKEEDAQAVREVLAGDKRSFEKLQSRYFKLIKSLIRRMIRDERDVDDLTQETFIKAYNALDTFRFDYSFSSWIYRIASNSCIDFLRKKRFSTVPLNRSVDNSTEEYDIEIEDDSYSADQKVLMDERRKALDKAVEKLPDNYKLIIKLRHVEELDYKEIAEKLDMPLGTVKAHLFRARKTLLSCLKNQKYLFY